MSQTTPHPIIAVGGVVLSADGATVCLIRRGQPPLQDRWSLPGGRVEHGERLHDALVRELREETGLIVRPGPLVEVVELMGPERHYVVHDFLCSVVEGDLLAGDDARDARWVPLTRMATYDVTEAVARVVARAVEMTT